MKRNRKDLKIEGTKNTLNRNIVRLIVMAVFALNGARLLGQQQAALTSPSASGTGSTNVARPAGSAPKPTPAAAKQHKLGPLNVSVNWRFRTEAWDFFRPPTGQNAYAFEHSLLRIGVGQKSEAFEWMLEGAADAIVDLPPSAVQPGRLGQLGLGGTYYAANGNTRNNVNGFVKQAYVGFKLPARGRLKVGRFIFFDGAEVQPKDKTLATLVNARVVSRLIGDFGFSAVQRSFDGARLGFNAGNNNVTLFGARPTRGVYQNDGMGELNVDVFYGAFTHSINSKKNAGSLRVFALGYVDDRGTVLKTDNRTVSARTADAFHIRIGTYGADYAHVFHTDHAGQFNFLLWGALQSGGWGMLTQRAGAFVGEAGWQPKVRLINPWFSAGYSFGSGDSNPNDNVHGTFFQVLPTPRPYDRFPFYNMMNNEDFYGSAVFRLPHSLAVRSELHALRLANAQDLWYGGGGAFQPKTFGYTGRASGGDRSLANVWDVSLDVPLRYGFSITTYYARAWGKSVIASIYPAGTGAQFGYVETNYRF
jgi:alginate export protein